LNACAFELFRFRINGLHVTDSGMETPQSALPDLSAELNGGEERPQAGRPCLCPRTHGAFRIRSASASVQTIFASCEGWHGACHGYRQQRRVPATCPRSLPAV